MEIVNSVRGIFINKFSLRFYTELVLERANQMMPAGRVNGELVGRLAGQLCLEWVFLEERRNMNHCF